MKIKVTFNLDIQSKAFCVVCVFLGLEKSMGYIVYGVAKSRMRLSAFHFCLLKIIKQGLLRLSSG